MSSILQAGRLFNLPSLALARRQAPVGFMKSVTGLRFLIPALGIFADPLNWIRLP